MPTSTDGDTVTISREAYDNMLEDLRFLSALEAAGVDNWDGYQIAREAFAEGSNE